MIRLFFLLLIGLGLGGSVSAQAVLASQKMKDFEADESDLFPYESLGPNGIYPFLTFDPALKLSDGSFFMIWKPNKISSRLFRVSRYDLLLNNDWEVEFELDRNEDVLAVFEHPKTQEVLVLSLQQEFFQRRFIFRSRRVDMSDGKVSAPAILEIIENRQVEDVFLQWAPDRQSFALYQLQNLSSLRPVSLEYDYVDQNQELGYRAYRCESIHFTVYQTDLSVVREGMMPVPDRKHVLLGCLLDNDENFYAYLHQRKTSFKVVQSHHETDEVRTLELLDEAPELMDLGDGEHAQLPLSVGNEERIYWALADLKRRGFDRGIRSYQVVCFDFKNELVDQSREVPVNSTLLVAVEKQRAAYRLRPIRRFDNYQIREVIEMPDKSVWLMVQQYISSDLPGTPGPDYPYPRPMEERVEEIVMFQFDSLGEIQKALVVPSTQYLRGYVARLGGFFQYRLDTVEQVLHMLIREADGEKFRDPDRMFYRRIDLESGQIGRRQKVHEGERRNQFWVQAYSTWMTPGILTFLMLETNDGPAHLVTVDLQAEPEPLGSLSE